ncbi:MAG: hypothetical protein IKX60_09040 [Bacteroidales bacterium]|nr:hypothetical protein [Bacteroidales bacterium]
MFKVTKFFLKIFFGFILAIAIAVWCVTLVVTWVRGPENPHDNMSFVIKDVERCDDYPAGTGLQCPICGKNFYKQDINFCSTKCEQKYLAMKREYDTALQSEKNLNKMGKKYK